MATQKKIIEMIGVIKTLYSYYAKDSDVKALVKSWTALLKDYPDKAVDIAVYKCLQTCKKPPTPADVIEQLKLLVEASEETDELLWRQYVDALDKVLPEVCENGYIKCPLMGETSDDAYKRIDVVWNGLHERLRLYIGSKGELMRMSRDYTDEDLKFEKIRFFKTMPAVKQRLEFSKLAALLSGETKMIEE